MALRGACSPAVARPRFRDAPQLASSFLPCVHTPGPVTAPGLVAAPARGRVRAAASVPRRERGVVLPPFQDKFAAYLEEAAASEEGREQVLEASRGLREEPPLLDIAARRAAEAERLAADRLAEDQWRARGQYGAAAGAVGGRQQRGGAYMAAPAQVERGGSGSGYGEHRPRRPPPDLPSLLLHSRIVYIGMPLVPAVTELVIAQLLYLQWVDPRLPTYVYLNSTGTSRADGETVGMETEGFAIYDTMMQVKNEVQTVGVGAAIGQACMLLAAGEKGRRCMLPHATAMIQQPRMPSMGQMPAIDIQIRAKEVVNNRDTLVKLLARHTGNSVEVVAKTMERPFYMNPQGAIDFGVVDKILWRGQEAMAETMNAEQWDKKAGIRVVEQ